MNRTLVAVYVLSLVVLLQSCTTENEDTVKVTGTVVLLSIEGGFFGIKGDDGKNYDPVNLPQEFKKDGLRVRFQAKELRDRTSIHMWGIVAEIISIQKL